MSGTGLPEPNFPSGFLGAIGMPSWGFLQSDIWWEDDVCAHRDTLTEYDGVFHDYHLRIVSAVSLE